VECTLRFAAPEAVAAYVERRPLEVHPSVDVWSLGVFAYELISGQRLFPLGASADDMRETLLGRRAFPHEIDPGLLRSAGKLRKTVAVRD